MIMQELPSDSNLAGQKILVTGASGFIGSRLIEKLADKGAEVHAISRKTKASHMTIPIQWWEMDLIHEKKVEKLLLKLQPDLIYHLASLVTGSRDLKFVVPTINNNFLTTINLLSAAAKISCKHVFLIGSMEEPSFTQSDGLPSSPYAASKYASTIYGKMFQVLYKVPVVFVKIFMVYGPGQKDLSKLIPYVILSFLRGEAPRLASGLREIDWIYIDDVVDGLIEILQAKEINGKEIDIGSGSLYSIRSIIDKLITVSKTKVVPLFGAIPDRPLEKSPVADVSRTDAICGWKAKVSLEKGLRETYMWYKQKIINDPSFS